MDDVASLINTGAEALGAARIDEARREASSLLAAAINKDRTFIVAHPEFVPGKTERENYACFIKRRAGREPFHYITGVKEFYGLEFKVTLAVLIPRPETEMLVERGISLLSARHEPGFCEVGAGSGCISAAILVNVPGASAVGLEISDEAIQVAIENAARLGVEARFELRRSDLFDGLANGEKFDLIVSNPPYIPAADLAELEPEVRDHEPLTALTDGGDGLSIIRRLVGEAPRHLKPGGTLMFEIGVGQAAAVRAMFTDKAWASVLAEDDFQGIPRTITARTAD